MAVANTDISLLAVSTLKNRIKDVVPDPEALTKDLDLAPRVRNTRLKATAASFGREYKASMETILHRSLEAATRRTLSAELSRLRGRYGTLSEDLVDEVQAEMLGVYSLKKYYGMSPAQRITRLTESITKEIYRGGKKLAAHPQPDEGARRVIRQVTGSSRGLSATRSGARLLVSEVNRAQAESVLILGRSLGATFYRWITVGDSRVSKLDRGRAAAITHPELPRGIDPRGVYTAAEIRKMPRHPYCRCGLEIVTVPGMPDIPEEDEAVARSESLAAEVTRLARSQRLLGSIQERSIYEPRRFDQSIYAVRVGEDLQRRLRAADKRLSEAVAPEVRAKLRLRRQNLVDMSPEKIQSLQKVTSKLTGKSVIFVKDLQMARKLARETGFDYLDGSKGLDVLEAGIEQFRRRRAGKLIVSGDYLAVMPKVQADTLIHYTPPINRPERELKSQKVIGKSSAITMYSDTEEDLARAKSLNISTKQALTKYQKAQLLDPTGYLTMVKEENLRGMRKYEQVLRPTIADIFDDSSARNRLRRRN